MPTVPDIQSIDAAILTNPVRLALGRPNADVSRWMHHPVSYINTEAANLGLHRFTGTVDDQGSSVPWSLVLKAVHAPVSDTLLGSWNYHRREILAYQSGLLADLPGGLLAPRFLGLMEHPDDVCWLWLEDVQEADRPPWSPAEYGLAARHLGRFNGAYAAGYPLPAWPWLSQDFLQGWLGYVDADYGFVLGLLQDPLTWQHPVLRAAFPRPITDAVLRLWARRADWLDALARMPRTFCHFDAYRPNLFLSALPDGGRQTGAIDWVFAGSGGLGEEIANLVSASLIWLDQDASAARLLDDVIFAGYLDGLRDAGCQANPRLVRFGYAAACALRWGLLGLWWLEGLSDSAKIAALEAKWGRPVEELAQQWAAATYYVLDVAGEAHDLYRALF